MHLRDPGWMPAVQCRIGHLGGRYRGMRIICAMLACSQARRREVGPSGTLIVAKFHLQAEGGRRSRLLRAGLRRCSTHYPREPYAQPAHRAPRGHTRWSSRTRTPLNGSPDPPPNQLLLILTVPTCNANAHRPYRANTVAQALTGSSSSGTVAALGCGGGSEVDEEIAIARTLPCHPSFVRKRRVYGFEVVECDDSLFASA